MIMYAESKYFKKNHYIYITRH